LFIFSPLPAAMRLRFALIALYSPSLAFMFLFVCSYV
jgi:hypothetical protein